MKVLPVLEINPQQPRNSSLLDDDQPRLPWFVSTVAVWAPKGPGPKTATPELTERV